MSATAFGLGIDQTVKAKVVFLVTIRWADESQEALSLHASPGAETHHLLLAAAKPRVPPPIPKQCLPLSLQSPSTISWKHITDDCKQCGGVGLGETP